MIGSLKQNMSDEVGPKNTSQDGDNASNENDKSKEETSSDTAVPDTPNLESAALKDVVVISAATVESAFTCDKVKLEGGENEFHRSKATSESQSDNKSATNKDSGGATIESYVTRNENACWQPQEIVSNRWTSSVASGPRSSGYGSTANRDETSSADDRWSCRACTFLNAGQMTSCCQCRTSRFEESLENAMKPLRISDCDSESQSTSYSMKATCTSEGFATNANDSQSVVASEDYWVDSRYREENNKWACPMCTFENWPASTKCSMCLSTREPSSNTISLRDTSNNNMDNIENNRVLSESLGNSSYAQRLRNRKLEAETRWLEACRGVVSGNLAAVEEYLSRGGDPARQLTSSEVALLNRPSAFDVGYTLVHIALRFQQEETLAMLLSHLDCSSSTNVVKRVPSYVAPDLDQDIRTHVMATIRYSKGTFRCNFTSEIATFTLPAEIQELPQDTQETLFDEILDRDVQKELESGQFINWSPEISVQLNSRLYALWNRSAGDCLLDSVLQATWGIFDKDNRLRQLLASSLRESASLFYQRWRDNELLLSHMLDFSLDENQCASDWDNLLSVAGQPGSSLEHLHIFALAHIFRRPIIVYSVKFVKSYLGETLGYARYEGVYLPFLWDSSLCWKSPISLGYTRGHFSALVPQEPHCDPLARVGSAAMLDADSMNNRCTYLPLNTVDGNLLPIHFMSPTEVGNEEVILSQWLELSYTNSGVLIARQRIQKRPLLVAQLVEEWLNHYRTLGQMTSTPYMRQSAAACYSSDGDSDND